MGTYCDALTGFYALSGYDQGSNGFRVRNSVRDGGAQKFKKKVHFLTKLREPVFWACRPQKSYQNLKPVRSDMVLNTQMSP